MLEVSVSGPKIGLPPLPPPEKLLAAMEISARVLEKAYRNKLVQRRSTGGDPSFIRSQLAISHKIGLYRSGNGAYAVVGTLKGRRGSVAPQLHFDEFGTRDRYTKDGQYRGHHPANRRLQLAAAETESLRKEIVRKVLDGTAT